MGFAGCCLLSLAWTLVGTLVTDDASLAIVETADGVQQVVGPGDRLGDCAVGAVAPEQVLLDCSGVEQRLPLSNAAGGGERAAPAAPPQPGPFALAAGEFRALLADRQRLAAQLSLEPAVAEGHVYGYRVASLDPEGELAGLGIAEGDVITAVNGAPASEPYAFVQTIDALAGQTAFRIDIERDGVPFALDYLLESSSRLP